MKSLLNVKVFISVETQHTIGYGGRATTENCEFASLFIMPVAVYLLCRVADLRENSLLEAHVRMVFIKDQEITDEGVTICAHRFD